MKRQGSFEESLLEMVCIFFTVLVLFVMITRLLLYQSSRFGCKRGMLAESSPHLPQRHVQRKKGYPTRKKKHKFPPFAHQTHKPPDPMMRGFDDSVDIEVARQAHCIVSDVVPVAETENCPDEKGFAQEDVQAIEVSIECQVLDDDMNLETPTVSAKFDLVDSPLELPVSSSCVMMECVQCGNVDAPTEPLTFCSELEDDDDEMNSFNSRQSYPRWVLLAHYVVSLRVAKGPPGLEDEPEAARVAAAESSQPLIVKAASPFCM